MNSKSDSEVQATNDDATCSKANAVKRGYWMDAYIHHFCPMPSRKSPEINRGYFIRSQAFKAITVTFIKDHNHACQIVSLGAGSDTLFFQLRDEQMLPKKFVELDLPHNVSKKISVIKQKKILEIHEHVDSRSQGDSTTMHPPDPTNPALHTEHYHLIGFDLRDPVDKLVQHLCAIGLDLAVPTLFLAECVLVYMNPSDSLQLIQGISAHFPRSAFLLYEQVNMCDRFGSIMVENFRKRGCELPGLSACESIQAQEKRFLDSGWKKARAWTISQVYQAFSRSTRSRVEKVEMLDDLEIAKQLFDHYCIVMAVSDDTVCSWSSLDEPLALVP